MKLFAQVFVSGCAVMWAIWLLRMGARLADLERQLAEAEAAREWRETVSRLPFGAGPIGRLTFDGGDEVRH